MRRRLSYSPPLALGRLLAFFAARAVPGVEEVTERTYLRSVKPEDGPGAVVELTFETEEPAVSMRVEAASGAPPPPSDIEAVVRRLLDLDADPRRIDGALSADPLLLPSVTRARGTRVPGAVGGIEMAVRAIVGQQVSVAGARTTLGRLTAWLGEPLEQPRGSITHLFPTAERLAGAASGELRMPSTRANALRSVARMVASGELKLDGDSDGRLALATLTSIPGVGPWTASYIAMRALRDADAFPATDLGVRRAFVALGLPDDARSIRRYAERWRPWRAYATMHLWETVWVGTRSIGAGVHTSSRSGETRTRS
jgi:AraC family transcriptional regulator of adaptative response / DNA-3-methyladenine glycosylase II